MSKREGKGGRVGRGIGERGRRERFYLEDVVEVDWFGHLLGGSVFV